MHIKLKRTPGMLKQLQQPSAFPFEESVLYYCFQLTSPSIKITNVHFNKTLTQKQVILRSLNYLIC